MNIGPKFKKNGQIVPYSIVGKSDSFIKSYNILKSRALDNNPMRSYNTLDELTEILCCETPLKEVNFFGIYH